MEAVVALLLAAGSDPSLTNYEGESPLNIAASKQVITSGALMLKSLRWRMLYGRSLFNLNT